MVVMVSLAQLEVLLLAPALMSLVTVVISTKGKVAQPHHALEQEIIARSTDESIVNDKDSGKIRIIAHDAKQCRQGAWVVQ
jgi:hypothetical protein